jgi:LPXTG-motif cell wall-anchored protein
MKNKGLIIGGVAIVALGAFFWMRRRNQMAEEQSMESDAKSDTSTSGSDSPTF